MKQTMKQTQKYIIRTDRAGVFFAEIKERRGNEADLVNARRIHYWEGAASLSQLSQEGVKRNSRLTMAVPEMTVLGIIEIIPCADGSVESLEKWAEWKV